MEVCKLPTLPLTVTKEVIRLFRTEWLGLMSVIVTIYCIQSRYRERRERRTDQQCSITAFKESRNFQTHTSTLQKQHLAW